jgi:hypothetical protein
MNSLKFYEIGGHNINVNAIAYVSNKQGAIEVHFIGGGSITINTQMSTFMSGIRTAK